jgi:putative tryptophan/tyrosine transport system substrate-binding protein
MRRRDFIVGLGSAAADPVLARAQQAVRRVGVLAGATEPNDAPLPRTRVLRDELQKLNWVEGRNLRLDFRFGAGDLNRTRGGAADLVRLAPDVVVTVGSTALVAAQQETKTVPIVFLTGDAADSGAVKNSARPEGNATGFATFSSLGGKWLQLLKEAAPNVTRIGYTGGPDGGYWPSIEEAARVLAVQLVTIPVSDAAGMKEAIENFAAEPNGGLLVPRGLALATYRELMRLAEQYRLPAIIGNNLIVAQGALMSYDSDYVEAMRGVASYVDRILRGAKVSELPVQYPTRFRLVVNLKTAKAIGLTIPETFLVFADEVIE